MLTLSHLTKKFSESHIAVDDFNLEIQKGEFVVLIGPSGCGKSTTLRMVNRLEEPTSGTVLIEGQDYRSFKEVELRRRLGYVIQQIGLIPHLTISENISFVLRLQGVNKNARRKRAEELMELAGLEASMYLDRYPRELSGGQQQRIGVLRALAHDPETILMDEPFGALDPIMREQLQDELRRLQKNVQKTIVFVTHDMDEALKIADRIVLMKDGKIVQVATPEEILRNPANDFVANFIGRQRLLRRGSEVEVAEIMLDKPVTIEPSQGLAQALDLMRRRRVDSLLLRGENDKFQGVVTLQDVQQALESNEQDPIASYSKLEDIGVAPNSPVMFVVRRMLEHQLDAIPVVDNLQRIIGVVTRGALVGILDDALQVAAATTETSESHRETYKAEIV